jgi:hypothetical protein
MDVRFRDALLAYAKGRYTFNRNRADGARAVVGHIAGIAGNGVPYRDVGRMLVAILTDLWHLVPGGPAQGLMAVLEHVAPQWQASEAKSFEAEDFWKNAVEALLAQVAIALVVEGDHVLIEVRERNPSIQEALDTYRV